MEDFGIADYFRILSRISASKKVDIGSSPKYGPDHIPDIPDQAPDLNLKIRGTVWYVWRINGSLILDFIFRISLDLHILKTLRTHSLFYFSTPFGGGNPSLTAKYLSIGTQ